MIGSEPQNCPTAGYYNFQHSVRYLVYETLSRSEDYNLKAGTRAKTDSSKLAKWQIFLSYV